tara:strand:+ start:509 stop:970 length:462 start_codon:yes stop_codon:yes gene_type:complete
MDEKKPEAKAIAIEEEDDKPDYQEKITFLVSTVAQGAILAWCLLVLSLGYVKLPSRLFGVDIPDQPRVDSTFAAGLLGNILGGLGISVNAAAGAKKKKKEDETNGNGKKAGNGSGYQTIIIKQPIELITKTPTATKVDPITGKEVDSVTGKLT